MFQSTFVLGNDQIIFGIFITSNIYHFFNLFIFILYIRVFWLNVCLCVCPQRQKRLSNPVDLELQVAISVVIGSTGLLFVWPAPSRLANTQK